MTQRTLRLAILLPLLGTGILHADVKLPAIFGDHMVLQQDAKLPVWGRADAGEEVTVTLGKKSAKTKANADGKWRVDLERAEATSEPQVLTVTGKNRLQFQDVLVGDVWVCSGQSNMVVGLTHSFKGQEEAKQADFPQLRLFFVVKSGKGEPVDETAEAPMDAPFQGKWQVCTSKTVAQDGDFTDQNEGGFSAVGYFFAKEIHQFTKKPVGIIGSYVGGTNAESWVSRAGLQKAPSLAHYAQELENPSEDTKLYYSTKWAEYVPAYKIWRDEVGQSYNESLRQWQEAAKKAKELGQAAPPKPEPSKPRPRNLNSFRVPPAALFNGMISPLIPYGIKGAIWYQGENNVGRAQEYQTLLPALISDWREQWGQGDFPFLVVQLASYGEVNVEPDQKSDGWPGLREAQYKTTLALPNTGMAVAIDIGDGMNIHPADKYDVALRLAQAAKKVAYGQDGIYSGPTLDSIKIEGNKVRVSFKNTGNGLEIGAAPWASKGKPEVISELKGFAIAGEDKRFVWAKAQIEGNAVVVWSDEVPNPQAVRYGWGGNTFCNLYNKEKLPAVPFRTDAW